jgi:hypothetical protein
MNGVNDSLLIAILLTLIFGAVSFYLYSRMSQTEKRLGLLENLLLQIKISTEASLEGPDSVEAISEPVPLTDDDVESVDAEEYSEMLKEIPMPRSIPPIEEEEEEEEKEEKEEKGVPAIDINYEAMSLAELKSFAKQKGYTGVQNKKKKEIIDMLKEVKEKSQEKRDEIGELGGVEIGENGFPVEMSSS